jgi:hypothetical protein
MQDDHIGPKIVVLGPADMARLPTSIVTKKYLVVHNLVQSAGTTHTMNLPCFTRIFLLVHISYKFLDFYDSD